MEDEDDRIPEPDSKGYLSLTNRAWVHLDPELFGYSLSLVSLDVSYNSILELPGQIGELVVLREFRCSFNKLKFLPVEIGRLKRLRKLHAQGNRLTALPIEVGRLEMLEELILSENEMEELPDTISLLTNLRIFKLQNNKLRALPYDISALFSLEVLDVGNNDTLTMVPKLWRSNTDSVLFICKIHQDYGVKMGDMLRTNHDLTRHSQVLLVYSWHSFCSLLTF